VTIIEAADRLLPHEEPESGALLAVELDGDGITIRVGVGVASGASVAHTDEFTVHLDGDADPIRAHRLLVATGRRPNINPETWLRLGLRGRPGPRPVDDRLRVVDGVWAVDHITGHVTGHGAFTHVATYQTDIAARPILGRPGRPQTTARCRG
jgi:pyruvate/2-oxoglutarate dehydrogenase complex dihydrolipoamide dehydrogenase (E3) component